MSRAIESFWPSKTLVVVELIVLSFLVLSSSTMRVIILMALALYSFSVVKSLLETFWPFKRRHISTRSEFNRGLWDTTWLGLVNMMRTGLSIGLILTLGITLPTAIVGYVTESDTFSLIALLHGSIIIFLPVFFYATLLGALEELVFGNWRHVLNHTLLRFILWRKGLAPRRYDQFLQMVVDRRLMRRLGGSVLFVHRYILEYFADQWEQKYRKL